jgi:hypothetical protein
MPYWLSGRSSAVGSGASTTKFTDVAVNDETTYEHVTDPSVESAITCYYDFGSTISVKNISFSVYFAAGSSYFSIDYSTDGTSFTNSGSRIALGGTGWQTYTINLHTGGTTVSARYVRLSMADNPSDGG